MRFHSKTGVLVAAVVLAGCGQAMESDQDLRSPAAPAETPDQTKAPADGAEDATPEPGESECLGGGEPRRGLELRWAGIDDVDDDIVDGGIAPTLIAYNSGDDPVRFELTVSLGEYHERLESTGPEVWLDPGEERVFEVPLVHAPSMAGTLSSPLRAHAYERVGNSAYAVRVNAPQVFTHYDPNTRSFLLYGEGALRDVFAAGRSVDPIDDGVDENGELIVVGGVSGAMVEVRTTSSPNEDEEM